MINEMRAGDRHSEACNVEQHLRYARPHLDATDTLHCGRDCTQKQRLRKTQLRHADEDKQKVQGHRTREPREPHFQRGCNQGQQQVDGEANRVVRFPVRDSQCQHHQARHDGQGNKGLRFGWHSVNPPPGLTCPDRQDNMGKQY